jgi:phage terminase large subunit-like protein
VNAARRGALERKLKRALQARPLLFFEPSPALVDFMRDESRRICLLAANRVGKTRHAAKKLAKFMVDNPGCQVRAVGPTSKMVNDVHARYLNDFLRSYLDRSSHFSEGRGFNNNNTILLANGSVCQLMSYEQDPDAHAGAEKHVVWLDEPPPRTIYEESRTRVMSLNGALWCTFTAVGRPIKWFRRIVEGDDVPGAPRWSFYQVAFRPEFVPWYTDQQIVEWLAESAAAPWLYAQKIEGAWEGVTENRSLSNFTAAAIVPKIDEKAGGRPVDLLHDRAWWARGPIRLCLAVDYGEEAGHAVWALFAWQVIGRSAYGPIIKIRVLAEWVNPRRLGVLEEAAEVQKMVTRAGLRLKDIDFAVGDINSAGKSNTGAKTLNEEYEAAFAQLMRRPATRPAFEFRAAVKGADSIDVGLMRTNRLLAEGHLEVYAGCEGLVEACQHWTGKNDDMKHRIDMLRYGVTAIHYEEGWEPFELKAA